MVFTSEKWPCALSTKDPNQSEHLSKVGYKFVCPSCNASYVGQTCLHLATRIDNHSGEDKKSHISQHIMSSKDCLDKCSKDCFSVLDTANTKHQSRIKESLYITWLKPILNKPKEYQYITFSFVRFLFFVSDLFDFIVWVIYLIATFSCFYIW